MTTADRHGQRAEDDSAREADDKSDEQHWNEIEAEEAASARGSEGDDEPAHRFTAEGRGKDGADGDEPPADDNAEDEDQRPSQDERDDGASDEGLHNLNPKELQEQIERLQRQLASEKGRTAAERRRIVHLRDQIASAQTAQRDQDASALREQREKRQQDLDKAREEYGDVIDPLVDQIKDLESRVERLSKQEERDLASAKAQLGEALTEQKSILMQEHPDAFDLVGDKGKFTDIFLEWIEDQPAKFRRIFAENQREVVDGTGAALLLGHFKSALAQAIAEEEGAEGADVSGGGDDQQNRLQSRRERQLRGAQDSRIPSRQATSEPPKDSDDAEAHWRWFEEQERRGRIATV